jgi:lysozyme
MMSTLPTAKPQASIDTVAARAARQWKKHRGAAPMPALYLVGVPGYYWESMGNPTANDRGIYDDAIFIISPTLFASFNANTDPSAFRKAIATLLPGVHPYRPGNHGISRPGGGYPAFRPATPGESLPVRRDGETTIPSTRPGIAINIHRGSRTSTSSEGCQTIPPGQWPHFHATLTGELKRHALKSFPYILLDPGSIA